MITILSIRFKQFARILEEIGVIYVILLLVVLFPLSMGVLDQLAAIPPIWTAGIMSAILLSIHLNRTDKDFVQLILHRPYMMYLLEYVVLAFPVWIWLMYLGNWLAVGILFLAVLVVGAIPLTIRLRRRQSPLLRFPASFTKHYEWVNGLRKSTYLMLPLYIVGLALSGYTATIPIVLFLLGLMTTDFYMDCEPRIFLELYDGNARSFLRKKIRDHLIIFWLCALPLVALFLVFHYSYWYILLVVIFVVSVFPVLSITLKYASYQPNIRLTQNSFTLGLMVAFLCVPFTQPVPLVMTVIYYRRAVKNLNDFN